MGRIFAGKLDDYRMIQIVIDMEMPDNCIDCRFSTDEEFTCSAVKDYPFCNDFGIPPWCPLKEVTTAAEYWKRKCAECELPLEKKIRECQVCKMG